MGLSLSEAARAVGLSKPTLQRAIKSGRLSASRRDDGAYIIDPAELHRVFPAAVTDERNAAVDLKRDETPVLQAENEGLRQQIALLKDERDSLREDRDEWRAQAQQALRLLTDQRPPPQPDARRGWWRRLLGW